MFSSFANFLHSKLGQNTVQPFLSCMNNFEQTLLSQFSLPKNKLDNSINLMF